MGLGREGEEGSLLPAWAERVNVDEQRPAMIPLEAIGF